MTLSAIIVDDEPLARDLLSTLLAEESDIDVIAICATAESALSKIAELRPDIAFLDIEIPEMNGLEIVVNLIENIGVGDMPQIIFTTAYNQYAVEAFRVNALDYVLKPLCDTALAESLQRVRQTLSKGEKLNRNKIVSQAARLGQVRLRDADRIILLPSEDIYWLEAQGDYVAIHLKSNVRLIRSTLKAIEQDLSEDQFQRVHRSSILNLSTVRELVQGPKGAATAKLSNHDEVAVSRAYGRILKRRLA